VFVFAFACISDIWGEGRQRKIKLKATYIWQMINGVVEFFFLIFGDFFMAFLCVSQQVNKGSSNTPQKIWGKSMSKTFGRKS
jgi:hypothetical protein